MPTRTTAEELLLSIAGSKVADIAALPASIGRGFDSEDLLRQVVSDRLQLAGEHLRIGDQFLSVDEYRTSISRHYYAMYHCARAVVFAVEKGDDYQSHSRLAAKLPATLNRVEVLKANLTYARLTRNEADYDLYPSMGARWELDARAVAVSASEFIVECNDFVLRESLV